MKDFYRRLALYAHMFSEEHDPHSASAKDAEETVTADDSPNPVGFPMGLQAARVQSAHSIASPPRGWVAGLPGPALRVDRRVRGCSQSGRLGAVGSLSTVRRSMVWGICRGVRTLFLRGRLCGFGTLQSSGEFCDGFRRR